MVNFGDAIKKGLGFCIEPKRWLQLFVPDAIILGIVLAVVLSNLNGFMTFFTESQDDPLFFMSLSGFILGFIILGAIWFIFRMLIMGSLIHQSVKPREVEKGYRISLSRLHKVVAVVVIVAIISGLVGSIPFVGWIFSLVIGWIFFFIFQGIILDNIGVVSTMKNSWRIFRKDPFDVFISWLLLAIISSLIMLIFAIPLLYLFLGPFLSSLIAAGTVESGTMVFMLMFLQDNLAAVISFSIIALVGLELSQVFAIKAQTELYLQFRKRFPSIIKSFKGKVGRFF